MRPIKWLHISDFHLRESQAWSQDAVLSAMLNDISGRVAQGMVFDFVLITGDLAFSGQDSQYALVEAFIVDLAATVRLAHDNIFCVAGNHDVDRARQTMCFTGARLTLQNESDIYSFLSSEEERETLLTRLHGFREFQKRCFPTQSRIPTGDGLAYVSIIDIEDIKIAIVGLNSAWLAEGGRSDHGQLLLGESQVTKAIDIVKQSNPHIVIGMAHHPFTLLSEFDRPPTQSRVEEVCHFFHCGHLHAPDSSSVATQSGNCLTLAAGASFESRESHNSYTVVILDPLHAVTNVTFVQFDPTHGAFSFESDRSFPHEVDATAACTISELASALAAYCPNAADFSFYLAALLVEAIADVPILAEQEIAFGTTALLRQQPDGDLKAVTLEFFAVSNAVKLLCGGKPLKDILSVNGQPVERYADTLLTLADADPKLRVQLVQRNDAARMFAGADAIRPFSHTQFLLEELRDAEEWDMLRRQAERHTELKDQVASAHAKRMLALCLGRSTDQADREQAIELYQELADSSEGKAADLASVATLLRDDGNYEQAATTVQRAMEIFPENADAFVEIGMRIVEATGDRHLRRQLLARRADRRAE